MCSKSALLSTNQGLLGPTSNVQGANSFLTGESGAGQQGLVSCSSHHDQLYKLGGGALAAALHQWTAGHLIQTLLYAQSQ
jgi:hypothetical protein